MRSCATSLEFFNAVHPAAHDLALFFVHLGSMEPPYVDTRLHIQITPLVEYKLPVVARCVRDFVFEDVEQSHVNGVLRDLVPREREIDVESMWFAHNTGLDTECVAVCTHMDEHLASMSHEWIAYLHHLSSEVRKATRHARQRAEQARSVAVRYRGINPKIVDQELRNEFYTINEELDRSLEEIRLSPEPNIHRSEELRRACESLKVKFSSSYGTSATRDLVQCRKTFEQNIHDIECRVSQDFVESIKDITKAV
jgi:hypothetical protein